MNLSEKIKAKIKWLRTQPENVKVRYVWVAALVVFVVVALSWAGLFRQYQRKALGNGKIVELEKEREKIKEDIGSQIKIPDIDSQIKQLLSKLPEVSPSVSPEVSVSPETSPEISPEVSPEPTSEIAPEEL